MMDQQTRESITAGIVFERDFFEIQWGDVEQVQHIRAEGVRGRPIGVYAAASIGGVVSCEFVRVDELRRLAAITVERWKKIAIGRLKKRALCVSIDEDDFVDEEAAPEECPAARRLRQSLQAYVRRQGAGDPLAILRELVAHDSFADLTAQEAERAHQDFDRYWLNAEAAI